MSRYSYLQRNDNKLLDWTETVLFGIANIKPMPVVKTNCTGTSLRLLQAYLNGDRQELQFGDIVRSTLK